MLSSLCIIGVVCFSSTGTLRSSFVLSSMALDANMVELLAIIIIGFMVANLLSWTEFTIISDSKVIVDSFSNCSSITDRYSFLGSFCRDLPSWNLNKEVRHVLERKFTQKIASHAKRKQRFFSNLDSLSSLPRQS